MQSKSDIKNRIKTVRETAQITKAMELISVSKMRKATDKFRKNRYYSAAVHKVLRNVMLHLGTEVKHDYISENTNFKNIAFVVVASDKGLAGEYNSRILKYALAEISKFPHSYIFTVGRTAHDFLRLNGKTPDIDYLYCAQDPILEDARRIAVDMLSLFREGQIDAVKVLYTRQVSQATHEAATLKLLPLSRADFCESAAEDARFLEAEPFLEFAPSAEVILDSLIPQYIVGMLMSVLIESSAAEHYERMQAMNNASENAQQLIEGLEIKFNRARQEGITTEIAEIASSGILSQRED